MILLQGHGVSETNLVLWLEYQNRKIPCTLSPVLECDIRASNIISKIRNKNCLSNLSLLYSLGLFEMVLMRTHSINL